MCVYIYINVYICASICAYISDYDWLIHMDDVNHSRW